MADAYADLVPQKAAPAPHGAYSDLVPKRTPVAAASAGIYGDLVPHSAPTPLPPKAKPVPGGNPLGAFLPVVTGAARAAGTGVGNVLDVLNRPHQAVTAGFTGGIGTGAQTLVHGQSEKSEGQTRAQLRQKAGIAPFYDSLASSSWTSPNGNVIPGHVLQGLIDFAIDTGTDPMTYLGGLGILKKGVVAAGRFAVPTFAKAVEQLGQHAPLAAQGIGGAFDFANFKGQQLRDLSVKYGAKGIDYFHGLKAINNARMQRAQDLSNTLMGQLDITLKGLPTEQRDALFQAVHLGTVDDLPDALKPRAESFKKITDSLAHLSGTRGLRESLSKGVKTAQEVHGPVQPSTAAGVEAVKNSRLLREAADRNDAELQGLRAEATTPVRKQVLGIARQARDAEVERRRPIMDAIRGGVKPSWVWDGKRWNLAGEYADVPQRFLDLTEKPKMPPYETQGIVPRVDGHFDQVATHLGMDEAALREWMTRNRREPRIADYMNEAIDRLGEAAKPDPAQMADLQRYATLMRAEAEKFDKEAAATVPAGALGKRNVRVGGGFELPAVYNRFDTAVRSLQRPSQYRKNYVPTAHDMDTPLGMSSRPGSIEELDQRIEGMAREESTKRTNPFRTILEAQMAPERQTTHTVAMKVEDKNLLERGEGAQLLEPEMQEKVIRARLRSGAKAIAARDAEREVARLFGVGGFAKAPAAAKAFFQETWNEPGAKDFWGGIARGAIDIPKVALFALPFRHMLNIGSLSVLADPSLGNIFGTAGRFARLIAAGHDADKRAAILGKAVKYGVSGTPSIDRQTAGGWIGKIPGVGDFYKASNHVLWTFDDAAKATRFQRVLDENMKRGMKESAAAYAAANDVGAELIDYSNRSPLTQALSYIAPFATYRSKLPGAVARAVAMHPERVLATGRAAPELAGDEQSAPGGKVGKTYLPLADTLRGVNNLGGYVRSTAGYPLQMALSGLSRVLHNTDDYATYGKAPDLKYLANQALGTFPGVQTLLDRLNLSEFVGSGGLTDLVRGQSGFGLKKGPSYYNLEAQQMSDMYKIAIDAARKRGQEPQAQALEAKLKSYLRYHYLYEK